MGPPLCVGASSIAKAPQCSRLLRNQKGAVLTLSGEQVGLIANADLSGLAISLQ
jgi:hypothetical protein